MKSLRILIALVGVLGAFFISPWIPLICIILLSLRFRAWEAVCIGVLVDMLWLPPGGFTVLPLFTLVSIAIVWALEPLRLQLLR